MGWEEAELHKCTLSTHRAHLLGNNSPPPPRLQPRAAKHFAASPAGTYGRWGRLLRGTGVPAAVHQACLPLPSSWGGLRQSWSSQVVSTSLASTAEPRTGCCTLHPLSPRAWYNDFASRLLPPLTTSPRGCTHPSTPTSAVLGGSART